jgi:hypothetical protein
MAVENSIVQGELNSWTVKQADVQQQMKIKQVTETRKLHATGLVNKNNSAERELLKYKQLERREQRNIYAMDFKTKMSSPKTAG